MAEPFHCPVTALPVHLERWTKEPICEYDFSRHNKDTMTHWKSLIISQASHLRQIFPAGTLTKCHCPREKVLRHSQPNRRLVPRGHENTGSAQACSADLWFQHFVCVEMIMQAAPWAPSGTIKVIRGAPPLHIQPYGETVDRWVFNCRIVNPSPQRGLGSLLYSRSAEFNTAQTLSLSLIKVSNLRLSLAFSQHNRYQPYLCGSHQDPD